MSVNVEEYEKHPMAPEMVVSCPASPIGRTVMHAQVSDAAKAIELYIKVFGGKLHFKFDAQDGKKIMHSALELGNGA